MRKISIMALFIFLSLQTVLYVPSANAEEYTDLYDADKCTTSEYAEADLSDYAIYEGQVYFRYCLIEDMDAETLKPLTINGEESVIYAQDKNHVYYQTRILKGLEPDQFKIKTIGDGGVMLYDDDTVYFDGTDITGINPDLASLEPVGESYFRDRDYLYIQRITDITPSHIENISFTKIQGGDPDNFSTGYKITPTAVYWYGKKIGEADPGSFELAKCGYSNDCGNDKNNVYCLGNIMFGIDTKSFGEVGSYCGDKNGVFNYQDQDLIYSIDELKKDYRDHGKSDTIVNEQIQSSIQTYESKYPGYEPQPAVPPVLFSDIPFTHSLWFQTKRAQELGFISGYPDGTFRPDSPVNRAEFAKMLTLAFNKGEGGKDILSRFPDVLFDQWYIPFLGKAVELRIMEGYPDGSMKPANTIIKAEALKMALEAKGGDYGSTASGEQWYEKYRKYAADHFNLTFLSSEDMGKPMTRGECVELILEALDK